MVRIIVFDWTGGRRAARDDGGQRSVGTRTVQYLNICKSTVLYQYGGLVQYCTRTVQAQVQVRNCSTVIGTVPILVLYFYSQSTVLVLVLHCALTMRCPTVRVLYSHRYPDRYISIPYRYGLMHQ